MRQLTLRTGKLSIMWRRNRISTSNHRVLSEITIWIWGIALIAIAVGSVWTMLHFFGNDPKGSTRLEAIRIASTIVVGTGGAAALLIAARRQRFTELDGTERRITELQTKAADQLGHEKAAVRLAGLHSLERLAQDNPSHRQTIVDIICAYLRMPFAPPPPQPLRRPIPGSLRQHRTPAWKRYPQHFSTERDDERFQEQQVRLTAQRILKEHLDPKRRRLGSGRPANDRFWKGMKIDLTGATLEDFDFSDCEIWLARFDRARFTGKVAKFGGSRAKGVMSFQGANFSTESALFYHVRYHGALNVFDDAHFEGRVDFNYAWLATASFRNAVFARMPALKCARFGAKKNDYLAPAPDIRHRADGSYALAIERFNWDEDLWE